MHMFYSDFLGSSANSKEVTFDATESLKLFMIYT